MSSQDIPTASPLPDETESRLGKGLTPEQQALVHRALMRATQAHGGQMRASGDPHLSHCIEVATILAGLHMDAATLAAALLHDVVEDTEVTLQQVRDEFGDEIAQLVDGATKLGIVGEVRQERSTPDQDENLRKMLLAMADDVRVILIKLADRLHNMRTLRHLAEDKRQRIARETLDIYAPLANRLGIWQLKWELEDLSLRYLAPETYHGIARALDERRADRERYIASAVAAIRQALADANIAAEVKGRPKHIYSIWRKMQNKNKDFDQIFDVRAVRILVNEVADCYAALGVIHTHWHHIPKEFDDYIANPKENHYQSLHTAVVGPEGKVLEVQIRTREMDRHAELGIAAHWSYKEGMRADDALARRVAWLRQVFEWKEENPEARDFIDRFKSEIVQDRVYVLTPQGRVVSLPRGATPLDFAYHVHTEIGHRCRGVKANGRMVPLTHELKNGEQVEVLTTRQAAPSRDWLNPELGYLKTSRARAKVRQWFKAQNRDSNITAGRSAVERELHRTGQTHVSLDALAERFRFRTIDDFLAAVGAGDITGTQIASAAYALQPARSLPPEPAQTSTRARPTGDTSSITVAGVGNLLTHLAGCCHPAPGDPIIGFITRGHGISVHRQDCRNVLNLPDDRQARLVEVEWGAPGGERHTVEIIVEAFDRSGLLRDVTTVLAEEQINVLAAQTLSSVRHHRARMELSLEIRDMGQLSRALRRIGRLRNVTEAHRKA